MISIDTERAARIVWSSVLEPVARDDPREQRGERAVLAHIATVGHLRALRDLQRGALATATPAHAARAAEIDPGRQEEIAVRLGARILTPEDEEWPTRLDELEHPPHCLWVRGQAHVASSLERSVSIVGARAASPYGVDQGRSLAFGLAERGFAIVSGGAFGIDRAAHDGTLAAGGTTMALLACGIDRAYPASHASLFDQIAEDGAVITELPPGAAPLRQRFLARNRMIAAATRGTLVVQAGLRSGSLNTARWARDLNRVIAAVPGPVTLPLSAGCHGIIRDAGAILVGTVDEAADAFGDFGTDAAAGAHIRQVDEDWNEAERLVYAHVPVRRPEPVDGLVAVTGLPATSVLAALARLHGDGVVVRHDSGWRKTPTR
ncbi:MAG: DNA-processing protein DprA [Nostocoides sp.]